MPLAKDTVVAWTPAGWGGRHETQGQVRLAPRPPFDAVKPFAFWTYASKRGQCPDQALAQVFIQFHTMVVRDGIDPRVAHEALLGIDEYAAAIAPDVEGATS